MNKTEQKAPRGKKKRTLLPPVLVAHIPADELPLLCGDGACVYMTKVDDDSVRMAKRFSIDKLRYWQRKGRLTEKGFKAYFVDYDTGDYRQGYVECSWLGNNPENLDEKVYYYPMRCLRGMRKATKSPRGLWVLPGKIRLPKEGAAE